MTCKNILSYASDAIRSEIARFESVHPSIYAVYDIMENLSAEDPQLCHQLKDHILTIEDCFVNSQEWTLSRAIPHIRLGILGSTRSGKSALVHRYLTGTYLQDESPEGGRFKKEASLDGQSHLLMIRDEGGTPDTQFSLWVDAVIFVFSLEDETSLRTVLDYYRILIHERQNLLSSDLPMILVGTQDSISEYRPRVIDEARARSIANDMNRSVFYETCATYGLNVDKVFHEICKQVSRRIQPINNVPMAVVNPTYNLGVNQQMGSYSVMAVPTGSTAPQTGAYIRSPSAIGTGSPTSHQIIQMTSVNTPSGGPAAGSRPSTPQQQQQQASQVQSQSGQSVPFSSTFMQQSLSGPNPSQLMFQSHPTQQPAPTTSRRSGKVNDSLNNNTSENCQNGKNLSTNVSSRPRRSSNNVFSSQKPSSGGHISQGSEHDLSQRVSERPRGSHSNSQNHASVSGSESSSAIRSRSITPTQKKILTSQGSIHQQQQPQQYPPQPMSFDSVYNGGSHPHLVAVGVSTSGTSPYLVNSSAYCGGGVHGYVHPQEQVQQVLYPSQSPSSYNHYSEYNSLMSDRNPAKWQRLLQQQRSLPVVPSAQHVSFHEESNSRDAPSSECKNTSAGDGKQDPPTPNSTPTQSRKQRRKSNILRKHDDEGKRGTQSTDPIGSGRSIPLKMGYLEKRSHKTLNKEWKKKFLTLSADGILTYYDNMKDYQENCTGKTIDLGPTTVKVPGVGYSAGMKTGTTTVATSDSSAPSTASQTAPDKPLPQIPDKNNKQTGPQHKKSKSHSRSSFIAAVSVPLSTSSLSSTNTGAASGVSPPDNESCEFQIVSLSNRKWRFWAESVAERDAWISAIKEATENAIQNRVGSGSSAGSSSKKSSAVHRNSSISFQQPSQTQSQPNNPFRLSMGSSTPSTMSDMPTASAPSTTYPSDLPATLRPVNMSPNELIQALRDVPGNQYCADCGAEGPMWASVNLGIVLCITCAGFHRDLGTHVSRVRSINLDTWPQLHVNVMLTIGNTMANSVWEAGLPLSQNAVKPGPNSSSAERGKFIREKYQDKVYLAPPPYAHAEGQQQLIDAIARGDTRQVILMLAINQQREFVNTPYSKEDQRLAIHIAATLGYLVYLQLLAWAFAGMNAPDGEGRNAYFYAVASGSHDCAEFLLHSGCSAVSVPTVPTSMGHQRVGQSTTPNTSSASPSTSSIGSNRQIASQNVTSNSTNVSSSTSRQRPNSAVNTSTSSISTSVLSNPLPPNVSSTGSGSRGLPN